MKKVLLFAAAVMAFASCVKDEPVYDGNLEGQENLVTIHAGAGGTDATGSAGLNGCVVWANGNYTAHNPGGGAGNWATWNDIIDNANSTWVSSNGTITAITSGTVGAETGVLYFV